MFTFIIWIIGVLLSIHLSVKLLRLDKNIMYKSDEDIRDDMIFLTVLSVAGSWIFAGLLMFTIFFKKNQNKIAKYIKDEK